MVSVTDGEELIKRATSQVKFDLIFTGLKISKVDAIDAVKLIKFTSGKNRNTPILGLPRIRIKLMMILLLVVHLIILLNLILKQFLKFVGYYVVKRTSVVCICIWIYSI